MRLLPDRAERDADVGAPDAAPDGRAAPRAERDTDAAADGDADDLSADRAGEQAAAACVRMHVSGFA